MSKRLERFLERQIGVTFRVLGLTIDFWFILVGVKFFIIEQMTLEPTFIQKLSAPLFLAIGFVGMLEIIKNYFENKEKKQ